MDTKYIYYMLLYEMCDNAFANLTLFLERENCCLSRKNELKCYRVITNNLK